MGWWIRCGNPHHVMTLCSPHSIFDMWKLEIASCHYNYSMIIEQNDIVYIYKWLFLVTCLECQLDAHIDLFLCTLQFKSLGLVRFFYVFEISLLCSPKLHLFNKIINLFLWWQSWISSSLQCHMILQKWFGALETFLIIISVENSCDA